MRGLWGAGTLIVAQATLDPLMNPSMLDRAIREGGLLAVVFALLYFYRRDTKWATEFWRDRATEFAGLIADNARASTDVAAALRENTVVVHQAKNVMATHLPKRRDDDA